MNYELREATPSPDEYVALREAAGMGQRSEAAARRGLPNSLHAVTAVASATDRVVGMGRLVGDGGCFYQIVDVAVHPDHQGVGLETRVVSNLLDYLRENALDSAYVSLIADVDDFYDRFGFEATAPESKGMALSVGDL
ncbi:GNAT family N-acetyltransferase [Halorussus limi]|uniref:GNAT family N-acetyltransferase n=1 Tax=Halorussus limi TaxID=2938695 RepID=A0A8U0HNY5_9EURY|nr:GNAT family N-acetyltransferase [Halorussus limi]UPV72742.1 GNAT family N-acetyltransferase [Halorussus limi]